MNVTQQDRKKGNLIFFHPHVYIIRSTRLERLSSAKGTNKYVKNIT